MIKQIILTNFYSFRQETINLNPETNILIGINGSGKSNFLKAIRLLQEGMSGGGLKTYIPEQLGTFDNILYKGEKESNTITLSFVLDHRKLNEKAGGSSTLFREDLVYTIKLISSPGENYFIEETLTNSGLNGKPLFNYLSFRDGKGLLSERSEDAQEPSLIQYNDYDRQQLALSQITDSDRYYPQTVVRKALRDIAVYTYFDTTLNSEIRRSLIPRSGTRLSNTGGNLAQIIQNIKNQNRSDYRKIMEAFKEVNPYFEEFDVKFIPGGSIELTLGEAALASSIHVSGISDGTLRYLCLLAILYNSNRGELVCIDEPEVGLHPDMIHGVATAIKHASKESTIIISTHSTALLNYFDLEQVRVFEKADENVTVVKQFQKNSLPAGTRNLQWARCGKQATWEGCVMAGRILFIEGAPLSESSGDLRKGFEKLLAQKLAGKMPSIKLGGGKTATVDKFKNNNFSQEPLLLVDLDGPAEKRSSDLKGYGLEGNSESVFFMIQEMESWFLSQPRMLDGYYPPAGRGNTVSEKLSGREAQEIADPKGELKRLTKDSRKKEYHETKHAVDLLQLLNATQLEDDFPDFKKLIEKLSG